MTWLFETLALNTQASSCGRQLFVQHTGAGGVLSTKFPVLVQPQQPFTNIQSLSFPVGSSHCEVWSSVYPYLLSFAQIYPSPMSSTATQISMSGATFEMEDQRQWLDASFKTYCNRLSDPHPYLVSAGQTLCFERRWGSLESAEPRINLDKNTVVQ